MSIPTAVKKASREAEKLQKQLGENIDDAPPEEKVEAQDDSQEDSQEAESQEATPEDTQEVAKPDPEIERLTMENQRLSHRNDVLQGKYNAEVPRMAGEIAELKDLIKTSAETAPEATFITDQQREEFGEDFIEFTRNVTKEQIGNMESRLAQLEEENAHLKVKADSVGNMAMQSREDKYYSDLDAVLPKWRELNNEQGFLNWLSQVDPFTGQSRQELLDTAHERLDANRVMTFFNAYLNANPVTPKDTLEDQVVPSKKGSTQTEAAKPTYTRAQIGEFYKDVALGHLSEEKRKSIERDIFAATEEGRVI
jgi:hypothetical protein